MPLSNFSKIIEKLVHRQLYEFLEFNNYLYTNQFGFCNLHSTNHALITITEKIRKAIDNGEITCGVFLDLQKAFDTVDHEILLSKLEHYGIRGVPLKWFKTFLTQRHQYVSIKNSISETLTRLGFKATALLNIHKSPSPSYKTCRNTLFCR